MSVVTSELSGGAGRRGGVAHVLLLIGLVAAVVVPVAHEVVRHAAAVLTGELVLLAGLVGAALLVTAVAAVVAAITPDRKEESQESRTAGRIEDVICDVLYEFISPTCRSCVCRGRSHR